MNLGMAIKAHRDRIGYRISPAIGCWPDVVGLNLYPAEPVTKAAAPVASGQKLSNFVTVEGH